MPNHWLLKTEPSTYSYADLVGDRKTVWDGVTNALALKHLRSMTKGDRAFIYHTGNEKQIVGIAKVVSDPYPNPKEKDPKFVVVDLQPLERLPRTVTLAEIKARTEFTGIELVRIGRLSVMPISEAHWRRLYQMAGGDA